MAWNIETYLGADALKFGMTRAQVEFILGPPKGKTEVADARVREERGASFPFIFYRENSLDEVSFDPACGSVTLDGIDLFRADPTAVLRAISSKHRDCVEVFGFIVSLGAGVALSGFHDGVVSQKAVSAFARGLWDEMLKEDGRPITF